MKIAIVKCKKGGVWIVSDIEPVEPVIVEWNSCGETKSMSSGTDWYEGTGVYYVTTHVHTKEPVVFQESDVIYQSDDIDSFMGECFVELL